MKEENLQPVSQRYKKNHNRILQKVICQQIRQPRRNG